MKSIEEVELKYRIKNRQDFAKLIAALKSLSDNKTFPVLRQTNYFFDTFEFALSMQFIALRLREENGKFTLCAKQGKGEAETSALAIRTELEVDISSDQAEEILSEKLSPELPLNELKHPLLDQINLVARQEPLKLLGSFKNKRTVIPIDIEGRPIALELDETTFNDKIRHYELEAELPPEHSAETVEHFLQDLFKQIGVEVSPSTSKAQRFFEMVGK